MKTLDKEKQFLGEEIEDKNELLSQEEKDKLAKFLEQKENILKKLSNF